MHLLTAFEVETASERGWDELENGDLLSAVEGDGFQVLLTADKSMKNEQRFAGRSIGAVVMSTNNWGIVRDHVPAIAEALHKCKPEQVLAVDCGAFTRRKTPAP